MHCTLCVNNTCTAVVQSLSYVRLFTNPWIPVVLHYLLEFAQTYVH